MPCSCPPSSSPACLHSGFEVKEAAWNRLLHALGLECGTPRSPSLALPFPPSSHLFFSHLLMQPLITADVIIPLESTRLLKHLHLAPLWLD